MQAEILKSVDEEAISRLHNLVEVVWKEEKITEDWRIALVCPIYKKKQSTRVQQSEALLYSIQHTKFYHIAS